MLVLGASPDKGGPGPIVTALSRHLVPCQCRRPSSPERSRRNGSAKSGNGA